MNDRIERLKQAHALILASAQLLKEARELIGNDCVSAHSDCAVSHEYARRAIHNLGRLTS